MFENSIHPPTLRQITRRIFIIAHKEDVSLLANALRMEGFQIEVVRGPYNGPQQDYVPQMKCLVNHQNAWRRAKDEGGFNIVVEADFVPVRGMGNLPAPFDSMAAPQAFGFLYAGGPIAYHLDERGHAHGHACTTVAYFASQPAVDALLEFFAEETAYGGSSYRPWDTYYSAWLRKRYAIPCYLPIRQYGEHGGIPNPEHSLHGMRAWHQADLLAAPLHFLPSYADGSLLKYRTIRARAYARGILRLLTGRLFEVPSFRVSDQKRALLFWGIARLLPQKRIRCKQPSAL